MGQTRPSKLFRLRLSYGAPDQKVTYAIRKLVVLLSFRNIDDLSITFSFTVAAI